MKRNLPFSAYSCLQYGFGRLRTARRKPDAHVQKAASLCLVFHTILLTLPAQLIAYYMSVARGIDPDSAI